MSCFETDFDRCRPAPEPANSPQTAGGECIEYGGEGDKNGLAQLVLALVNLIHDLLEKQAIRRMEAETLTDQQLEDLGQTLMHQAEEIERLRQEFDLDPEDLDLDLGGIDYLG